MNSKKIKCDVETCKFNDVDSKECNLDVIKVSSMCDNCHNTSETICSSFKKGE